MKANTGVTHPYAAGRLSRRHACRCKSSLAIEQETNRQIKITTSCTNLQQASGELKAQKCCRAHMHACTHSHARARTCVRATPKTTRLLELLVQRNHEDGAAMNACRCKLTSVIISKAVRVSGGVYPGERRLRVLYFSHFARRGLEELARCSHGCLLDRRRCFH